jgi:hypothetical protein
MQLIQQMQIAAKSGSLVTLGTIPGGTAPTPSPDGEAHPKYLKNLAIVITTTLATADPTFWGCGAIYRVEIQRAT